MISFRIFLLAGLGSIGIVSATYFWMFGSEKKDWIIAGEEKGGNYDEAAHAIRRETTRKPVADKLDSDDFFVILQRQLHTAQQLVNEQTRQQPARRSPSKKATS